MRSKYVMLFSLIVAASFLLGSCGGVKHAELIMFEDVQGGQMSLDSASIPILLVQPDDILNIQVSSRNPETVIAFRTIGTGVTGATSTQALGTPEGYRVDESGSIYLPFIGEISAAGKTLRELRLEITGRLEEFIPDASVQVRFVNFRVTLMGEVLAPNTYVIPNERMTILEAIGMAGDFTPYARRDAVLVIRERNEVREFARVNTQDPALFMSPYFYLSPNDIVYVEPLKAKEYATQGDFVDRYGFVLSSLISTATFIVGILIGRN